MFHDPFYRSGNYLVSPTGFVIEASTGEGSLSSFRLHVPGNCTYRIVRDEHPEEYARYLALFQSAPLLIALLTQVQEADGMKYGDGRIACARWRLLSRGKGGTR